MMAFTPRKKAECAFRRLQTPVLYALVAVLIAAALAGMWRLGSSRWICVDEFEHLHAAWSLTPAGGNLTPYHDFFEHHTPLLYYGLAPVLGAMHPEQSFEQGWAAVIMSRRIMWVLAALTLLAIYLLGRAQYARTVGVLAVVFSLLSMKMIDRMIEIRPDAISVPCIVAALWLTAGGIRAARISDHSAPRPRGERWRFFGAGVLFGLAVLATPKTLFALLGYAPAMVAFVLSVAAVGRYRGRGGLPSLRRAMTIAVAELAGFVLPIALMLTVLGLRGGAWAFIEHNFLLNARWHFQFTLAQRWGMLGEVAYENPFLGALGVVGLIAAVIRFVGRPARHYGEVVLATTTAGLVAGVFIIPVAYDEYFLMLIPLLAIFEAEALLQLAGHLRAIAARRPSLSAAAYMAGTVLALGFITAYLRPPLLATSMDRAVWIGAGLAFVVLLRLRLRHGAIAAALIGMLAFGLPRFSSLFAKTNESTRQSMRYVHEHSGPNDRVMDGWDKITAPFRSHAWRYFFLHREIRPMVASAEWAALLEDMRAGRFHPALIVWDRDNQDVPPAIAAWITAHYEPIPPADVPTADPADSPLLRPRRAP